MPKSVGYHMRDGWKEPLMMYSFYCKTCKKQVVDYLHGYDNYLQCPICMVKVLTDAKS